MKRLVFMQGNLRMVKGMPIGKSLKELNPDTVAITKVLTLPRRDEKIDDYFFLNRRKMHKD